MPIDDARGLVRQQQARMESVLRLFEAEIQAVEAERDALAERLAAVEGKP